MLFDGGLNNKFERSIIAENESPSCANVVFTNGAVETRGGALKLNTAAIGSFVGDGLYTRHDSSGAETMVAFAGGTMWGLTGTSFITIGSAQSVFTAGIRVGTTQYENHMFIGNGGVTPYKYNGTAFTRHGVPAPGSVPTGTVSGGGTLASALYYYKVSYVNAQSAEGDVGAISTAFSAAASGSVELTGIPVAPASHGVGSRRIYRASGVAGSFQRIATIANNTTTTLSDTGLAVGAAAPTDNGEPPRYSVAVYHQNRLFVNDAANPNYVWYSDLFEPYTFQSTNFLPIGDASRDLVKGLEVYNNSVLVSCENSPHLIYMPSADDTEWSVIRLLGQFGSRSPFGSFLYNNKAMLPAFQNDKFAGFAAISGQSVDPAMTLLSTAAAGSDLKSDLIEPDMFAVQEPYAGNISSMVFKNKAYVSVTYGDNQTTNNRIYIFDFSRSNIKRQEASWAPLTGLAAAQFTVYNSKLYFISSTATGFVYQLEYSTYSDSGTAIDSYLWTKEISGNPGHENLQKDFRKVKLLVEKSGNFYMNLTFRVNSDNGDGTTKQVDLSSSADNWGTKNWGTMVWGSGTAQEEITIPLGQVSGKRIQFKFSNQNTAGQRFKVLGFNLTYNIKGRR
jgi:hypothetical protein